TPDHATSMELVWGCSGKNGTNLVDATLFRMVTSEIRGGWRGMKKCDRPAMEERPRRVVGWR
ncbi:hypothetical protein Tco_1436874, partial [Tanacetum coccineum]